MNRRKFISTLVGGIAASAAVRTWPFRVFSFPSVPRIIPTRVDRLDLSLWGRHFSVAEVNSPDFGLLVMPDMPSDLTVYCRKYLDFQIQTIADGRQLWNFGFKVPPNAKILDVQAG